MTLKNYRHYRKYLERKYCLAKFFSDITRKIHLKNVSISLNDYFHNGIQVYLKRYLNILHTSEKDAFPFNDMKTPYDDSIFVCWLQGIESAPDLVKSCFKQLQNHSNGRKIVLLTEKNAFEICPLPKYMVEKYNSGLITKNMLANLLRLIAIYKYGGLWIDATIITTAKLDARIFSSDFYTIKKTKSSPYYIPRGLWTTFFLASKKGCKLPYIVCQIMLEYWKEHNQLIDYFLFDHTIKFCYDNSSIVRELIDSVPYNNPDCDFFKGKYNQKFNQTEWDSVTKDTSLFKLSYKENINSSLNNTYYTTIITPPHQVICIGKNIYTPSVIYLQEAA